MDVIGLGVDTGTNLTGWAVGDGASIPTVGAWRFQNIDPDDHGALGLAFKRNLEALHAEHGFTHVVFERSFIARFRASTNWLCQRLGVDMILQVFCEERGIVCEDEPPEALKRALTGDPKASKDQMVAAALRAGCSLPQTAAAGRKDAADGFAAWLIWMQHYSPQHAPMWDARIFGRASGALI